jgi:hypothetical protein
LSGLSRRHRKDWVEWAWHETPVFTLAK